MDAELPARGKLFAAAEPVFERAGIGRLGDLFAFEEAGLDGAAGLRGEDEKRLAIFAAARVGFAVERAVEVIVVEKAVDRRLHERGQAGRFGPDA